MKKLTSTLFLASIIFCSNTSAQLLKDKNGDAQVNITAFGDSLTRGVGDFIAANQDIDSVDHPSGEAGYPLRVESLLNVPVRNLGSPGERFTTSGIFRLAQSIPGSNADLVVVSGGANDAIFNQSSGEIFRNMQIAINIIRASGKEAVLMTINPTCCDRSSRAPIIRDYNNAYRYLANINNIALADVARGFNNTCPGSISSCSLLNRPEGEHPNIEGYDVAGEVVVAALLEIDLFSQGGAADLEGALNLPEGSVKTASDPIPAA